MTAETLRDNLLAVRPNTEILVRDHKGRDSLLYSIEVSAGGTEPDSVVLHLSPYPSPGPEVQKGA